MIIFYRRLALLAQHCDFSKLLAGLKVTAYNDLFQVESRVIFTNRHSQCLLSTLIPYEIMLTIDLESLSYQ